MACFRCNTTENFIFQLKYGQQKVHLNTRKKSLVFVTIRHTYMELSYMEFSYMIAGRKDEILSLRPAIIYENSIFTQRYAFAERCCFLTFLFEGKLRKNISVKRKHTKTNENMIFSPLFTNFRKTKILFFMQCTISIPHENVGMFSGGHRKATPCNG